MSKTSSASVERPTLQILVSTHGDRAGLQELLGDDYEFEFGETLQPVDCYILTSRTFPQYVDELKAEKARQDPAFCPVLLVQQPDARVSDAFLASEAGWEVVDDIVTAPVEPAALHRRLKNLITRRRQSISLAREYERAESWFRGIFDAIPDPAFVARTDGVVEEVNDAFCALVGIPRNDVLGTNFSDLETAVPAFERFSEATQSTEEWVVAFTDQPMVCHGETDIEYVLLSAQTATVQDTEYVIGVLSDVTELQTKTERLEKLASVLTHDLRNPVQVAELNLQTLRQSYPDSEETIGAIQRAVDRINELTEELVAVARTGENMEFTTLEVEVCAREAWDHVETGGATLVVEQSGRFEGDRNRVLQLFENLFRNCVEHGGESVTVWAGATDDGFYVEDDGPGIDPENRDDVFTLGYSTMSAGNGLGLGIVSEIVDAHEWTKRIERGREGGARFEIRDVGLTIKE